MSLFDAGPWDNKAVAGAHVFSSERKLLYGAEHDKAEHLGEGQDAAAYGKAERHKMHAFWRSNALKSLAETVRNGKEGIVRKVATRSGNTRDNWPGDMGKHHAIIEELVKLKVVTLHQDEKAVTYAKVHAAALHRAIDRFVKEAAKEKEEEQQAAGAAAAAAAGTRPDRFTAAAAFDGFRAGCVFKMGADGLGYYRDGPADDDESGASGAAALPPGWVAGVTPEGYTYYWHTPTSTSSWEVPTGEPPITKTLPLAPRVTATLLSGRGEAVRKLEDQSGASIVVDAAASSASVRGSAGEVARAIELIERKAGAIEFAAASAMPVQNLPGTAQQAAAVGDKRKSSEYDFRGVAGFVAEADAARAALKQRGGGGALAALAQYDDDDEEDD